MIELQCHCQAHLRVPDSFAGKSGRCPKCKSVMHLVATDAASGPPFDTRLVITGGPTRRGEQFFLPGSGQIGIGRAFGLPIVLPGEMVSHHHCRLIRDGNGPAWIMDDLDSENGVFINFQRTKRRLLSPGDVIQIGDYELACEAVAPAATGAAPATQDDDVIRIRHDDDPPLPD